MHVKSLVQCPVQSEHSVSVGLISIFIIITHNNENKALNTGIIMKFSYEKGVTYGPEDFYTFSLDFSLHVSLRGVSKGSN